MDAIVLWKQIYRKALFLLIATVLNWKNTTAVTNVKENEAKIIMNWLWKNLSSIKSNSLLAQVAAETANN